MIKLYGIFHIPTGKLVEIHGGRNRLLVGTTTIHLQKRLDKRIDSVKNWGITYGNKKHTSEYLQHCEVREVEYVMGDE